MTNTNELIWYSARPNGDSTRQIDTLDLFGQADGLCFLNNGFIPAIGDREALTIKETFTLRTADGLDTFDELAAVLATLNLWEKRVAWSQNDIEQGEVWWRTQLADATLAVEAQVIAFKYTIADDPLNWEKPYLHQIIVTLERTPWEPAKNNAIASLTFGAGAFGGLDQATVGTGSGDVTSDLQARIELFQAYSSSALTEFWFGLMSSRLRDPTAFVPVWPLSAAQLGNLSIDTAIEADAGNTYNDQRVTCDFSGTEEAQQRVKISLADIAAIQGVGFDDEAFYAQTGHYEILLRARVSAANTEVHLRIGYGWLRTWPDGLVSTIWRDLVPLTSQSYILLDMQSIAIPPGKVGYYDYRNFCIAIEASRVAGAGSLYLDCVGLVPLDEGAIHILTPQAVSMSGGAPVNRVMIETAPNGQRSAYMFDSGYIGEQVSADAEIWQMPTNGDLPYLVAFAQRDGSCDVHDTFIALLNYCKRYRLMRGAGSPG